MTLDVSEALRVAGAWARRGEFDQAAETVCKALPIAGSLPTGSELAEVLEFAVDLDSVVGAGSSRVILGRLAALACRPPWTPQEPPLAAARTVRLVELARIARDLPVEALDILARQVLTGDQPTARQALLALRDRQPDVAAAARVPVLRTTWLAREVSAWLRPVARGWRSVEQTR